MQNNLGIRRLFRSLRLWFAACLVATSIMGFSASSASASPSVWWLGCGVTLVKPSGAIQDGAVKGEGRAVFNADCSNKDFHVRVCYSVRYKWNNDTWGAWRWAAKGSASTYNYGCMTYNGFDYRDGEPVTSLTLAHPNTVNPSNCSEFKVARMRSSMWITNAETGQSTQVYHGDDAYQRDYIC